MLLGLPEDALAAGRALGRRPRQVVRASTSADDLPEIEAALDGLRGYVDERRRRPAAHTRSDDLVTTLVQAVDEEGAAG